MDSFSFLGSVHGAFIEELYQEYLENPDAVEPSWRTFFQGYSFAHQNYTGEDIEDVEIPEGVDKEFKVINLINGYRTRGHLFTKTNPVRQRREYKPDLALQHFGLDNSDLDTVFQAGSELGIGAASLRSILSHLNAIYCDHIGVEFMYIREPEELNWIKNKLHINDNRPVYKPEEKKNILSKLNQAVGFENFLHKKFVGQKRFSLEGGESLIPALDKLVEKGSDLGVEEVVVGMAHRGRLNVLTNIFGKEYRKVFSEFEGKDYIEDDFDGDVKYHLGYTREKQTSKGKTVKMSLTPNPSHLETVASLVQGISRSKIDQVYKADNKKVVPVVIHGDAAVAGQGIVYEIAQMAQLKGYKTGGSIHIVINNQVGFTTNYLDARSSTYCTDVAKTTLCPVLHVNGDDAEAVVHAVEFAIEYRQKFHKDVYIDLLCYRKYGHNEGDEPRFTQPKLYKAISKHQNPKDH
jgi:2-oxoglutarate dehydrogenase E1 component